MEQPITDYVKFLEEAKAAVIEFNRMQDQEEALNQRVRQSQKELDTEKKHIADTISQTVKKRREEINGSYDKELSKGQEELKKARSKRESAKSRGVKVRILEETEELQEENRELALQIKTLFQQNNVPAYCNTKWYHALFMPHWISDFIKLLITVLGCFLGIPCGIYLLIPNHTPLHLAVIYFLCIILFGGIYVLVGNRTKIPHVAVFQKEQILRNQIHSNNKKIRVITHTIRKDKNEAIYDLQKYDDEIARAEQELAEIAMRKKDALNTFETVTKNIITDEISDNSKDKLAYLESLLDTEEQEHKELTAALKSKNLYLTDHYGTYLGAEFLQLQKLEELRDMVQNGTYANLSEAITEYKSKHA